MMIMAKLILTYDNGEPVTKTHAYLTILGSTDGKYQHFKTDDDGSLLIGDKIARLVEGKYSLILTSEEVSDPEMDGLGPAHEFELKAGTITEIPESLNPVNKAKEDAVTSKAVPVPVPLKPKPTKTDAPKVTKKPIIAGTTAGATTGVVTGVAAIAARSEDADVGTVEKDDSKPITKPKEIPCNDCEKPLVYVEKYKRYYCKGCKTYAKKDYVEKSLESQKADALLKGTKAEDGAKDKAEGKTEGKKELPDGDKPDLEKKDGSAIPSMVTSDLMESEAFDSDTDEILDEIVAGDITLKGKGEAAGVADAASSETPAKNVLDASETIENDSKTIVKPAQVNGYIKAYTESYMDLIDEEGDEANQPLFYKNFPYETTGYILPNGQVCALFKGNAQATTTKTFEESERTVERVLGRKNHDHFLRFLPNSDFDLEKAKATGDSQAKEDLARVAKLKENGFSTEKIDTVQVLIEREVKTTPWLLVLKGEEFKALSSDSEVGENAKELIEASEIKDIKYLEDTGKLPGVGALSDGSVPEIPLEDFDIEDEPISAAELELLKERERIKELEEKLLNIETKKISPPKVAAPKKVPIKKEYREERIERVVPTPEPPKAQAPVDSGVQLIRESQPAYPKGQPSNINIQIKSPEGKGGLYPTPIPIQQGPTKVVLPPRPAPKAAKDLDVVRLKKTVLSLNDKMRLLEKGLKRLEKDPDVVDQLKHTVFRMNRRLYETEKKLKQSEAVDKKIIAMIKELDQRQKQEFANQRKLIMEEVLGAKRYAKKWSVSILLFLVVTVFFILVRHLDDIIWYINNPFIPFFG